MNWRLNGFGVLLVAGMISPAAQAQDVVEVAPSNFPSKMEEQGQPASNSKGEIKRPDAAEVNELLRGVATTSLSGLAQKQFSDAGVRTRSAKDAEIYRAASPSVVLVVTNDGFGSGSIIGNAGEIITNWHVIRGYKDVAVVLKPTVEGQEPAREDMLRGHVVKLDEIADLATVKVTSNAQGKRKPIRLGGVSEISIGADVHAIGHPTGEAWTYTKGVISQYRAGYDWVAEGDPVKHRASVIQTQTPINPGNSGGPLLSDAGDLIGVNSFKSAGEGLNFAVSIEDINLFLTRSGNRIAQASNPAPLKRENECTPRELSTFRSKQNDATITAYDIDCSGREGAELVLPDKPSEPFMFLVDRNRDGKPDVIVFDFKRVGRWDLSFWDEHFDGHWTLVGYHPDGTLIPSSFESFEAYKRRIARR
jgi:S1-C subfamily serine protease